jgi:hypothetical protein
MVKMALTEGPRRASDLYKEAETQGFIVSTVRTASERIGVRKANQRGEWYWDLGLCGLSAPSGVQ